MPSAWLVGGTVVEGDMHRVAVKFSSTFGKPLLNADGSINGENSGVTLLKRVLGLFPDPILLVPESESDGPDWPGFERATLAEIDVNRTVIVSFDVIDSVQMYLDLKKSIWLYPKIVNFVWFNVGEYTDRVQRTSLALSCATFPTFCNSARTVSEVSRDIGKYVSPAHQMNAVTGWANLGIEMPPLVEPETRDARPRVLYPSMYLFARKQPQVWLDIVGRVAARVDITGRMALNERALRDSLVIDPPPWLDVDGLVPRDRYWDALASDDVFLATALDESYGLSYLEALWAGQIGVFPDRAWARAILPPDYPLFYGSQEQAEHMLHLAVTQPAVVRLWLTGIRPWLKKEHEMERFDSQFVRFVDEAFPERGA